MAPMPVRERDPQTGEKTDETRVLFKAVSVFDRQQVAAIDGVEQTSLEPPCEPLTGDSHARHRTHQQRRLHRSRRHARPDRPHPALLGYATDEVGLAPEPFDAATTGEDLRNRSGPRACPHGRA
jgi:hypothetical protein